ncbi:MAG: response regulator [Lentisphaeraceae bacterium]|nr:response regulator [Lentisphaeraceae bacterium]
MKKKVLIVDDERASSLIFQTYLNYKENWNVEVSSNAIEAYKELEGCEYDIVISDLFMPGVNGLEFLSRVSSKYPTTIRVLYSADLSNLGERPSYIHFLCEKGKFSVKELADKICALADH